MSTPARPPCLPRLPGSCVRQHHTHSSSHSAGLSNHAGKIQYMRQLHSPLSHAVPCIQPPMCKYVTELLSREPQQTFSFTHTYHLSAGVQERTQVVELSDWKKDAEGQLEQRKAEHASKLCERQGGIAISLLRVASCSPASLLLTLLLVARSTWMRANVGMHNAQTSLHHTRTLHQIVCLHDNTYERARARAHTHTHTCVCMSSLHAASLEAILQGANEKASKTQQQLDTTSQELAALQEKATQQGVTLDSLHK
eukprot:1157380-Pelagomonas_calceolata.AAC.9